MPRTRKGSDMDLGVATPQNSSHAAARADAVTAAIQGEVLEDDADPVEEMGKESAVEDVSDTINKLKDKGKYNKMVRAYTPPAAILDLLQSPELKYIGKLVKGAKEGDVECFKKLRNEYKELKKRFKTVGGAK